jgi:hypothetical protein
MSAKLPTVLVGDTFKQTFVASGTTPSVITASILDGTETIVSSGAGVNSGNGQYYRYTLVNTPGYYVSQWQATILGNPYKRRLRIKAVLGEVD